LVLSPAHLVKDASLYPSSQGDNRDEAGEEAAHQEEETILDRCRRLAEAEKIIIVVKKCLRVIVENICFFVFHE
jgi:hypothetical protein